MEAIKTGDLTKRYGELIAVDKLNLTVHTGQLYALLGVNGAGKTTTIKMLSCLSAPSAGEAFLDGKSILTERAAVKSVIGMSPQETAVAPNLTVEENLELMCGVHGFDRKKRREKVDSLCAEFDLTAVRGKRAGKLSGGWQRRLSIAMALIGEPKILFLDEPTLGLDVIARGELWDSVRALKGKVTVILTTHYMEEAAALADCVGIMANGKLLMQGTVAQILEKTGTNTLESAFLAAVKGAKA